MNIDEIGKRIKIYGEHPDWAVERASRIHTIQTKDVAWIFGVGRSGSTWLTEMLGGIYGARVWYEPYFGSMLTHPFACPSELDREEYFFANRYQGIWHESLRTAFLSSVRARFGRISKRSRVIVKDVNAPQLCPHFAAIFPDSLFVLLVRDPYDVLDSHLDMRRPDSWNPSATDKHTAEEFAEHIKETMEIALQGYSAVRDDRRLLVRYRDLLFEPTEQLNRLVSFLGLKATEEDVVRTVEAHRFENFKDTGRSSFRRFGRSGIWRESGNFTPEVLRVAERHLGDLRFRLGYETTDFSELGMPFNLG